MPEFTPELFDEICERISEGESLRQICLDDHMPNKSNVFRWLADDANLRDQYARARDTQADVIFDECLKIADDAKPDEVQLARLQIDTRKWMAGKLRPKRYGEKLDVTSGGKKLESTVAFYQLPDNGRDGAD